MNPVENEFVNATLGAPLDNSSVIPLPVWTDGQQCVSEWKLTLRERIKVLLFGRIWLAVLSGKTQPPVAIVADRRYLEHTYDD